MTARRLASDRWAFAALAAAAPIAFAGCGDDSVVSHAPQPLACRAPERPRGAERVQLEPVFPGVVLDGSVALVMPPGDPGHGYVVVQSGTLWRFELRADATPTLVASLEDEVELDGESGFLDIAFHPRFPEVPEAFFSFVATVDDGDLVSRVTRMVTSDGGATFDRSSESLVLEVPQPYSNHKGGELAFGPDGYLYFSLGDGGGAGDPFGNGQNTDVLLGKVLRIDIDVDGTAPFAIPADNPFASGGGRPEIFAVGFRNPWRFSFDEATGDLWVGDVGQHEWEEVDKVTLGGNYGWSVMEGESCFAADACDTGAYTPPVAQYRNTGGASVIGGLVLHGGAFSSLEGTYIFSDFFFGTIFGIDPVTSETIELGGGAGGIAAWTKSAAGEVLGIHYGGEIARLVAAAAPGPPDTFPKILSETGCVDIDHPRDAAHGTLPYDVRVPFWSDGADKARFIAKGDGEIVVSPEGDWDLPAGTVLVKSFFRGEVPVETRLLVRHDDGGWAGYGYAWRLDGSDADLVERGREETREGAPWVFPSSRECDACHTDVAGFTLALTTPQLAVDEQLATLVEEGLIAAVPEGAPLPATDGDAPIEDRARAYLEVNCAMCHQPSGPDGRAQMDLRAATPFVGTGLCNGTPNGGSLGVEGAVLLAPGDPPRSILSVRLHATGYAHMPPIGIATVDEGGAAVVDEWIRSIAACP